MSELKYIVGDKVRIESEDWYKQMLSIPQKLVWRNKLTNDFVGIWCGSHIFKESMFGFLGKTMTIQEVGIDFYLMEEDTCGYEFNDEMIEGLVEEETKSENWLLDEYEELTDRAFKGGYEKCKSDIELNGFQLPEGYIFKDQAGNEIHALKIVLEKANTLKTQSDNTLKIQSDNMETETHRGYYTTEEETTNKSKKVAWFTFWDNDFADKVELDLSNRELIQEDGKWFVVKKKKEYPKTYEECCKVLDWNHRDYDRVGYKSELLCKLQVLLLFRDAYWKLAGDEMGLGKPWEPDWNDDEQFKYIITCRRGCIIKDTYTAKDVILAFPTQEMRDAFYENFKRVIEFCKELL